eukprot:1156129-Pelagomonas_calceolata.AAC.1
MSFANKEGLTTCCVPGPNGCHSTHCTRVLACIAAVPLCCHVAGGSSCPIDRQQSNSSNLLQEGLSGMRISCGAVVRCSNASAAGGGGGVHYCLLKGHQKPRARNTSLGVFYTEMF